MSSIRPASGSAQAWDLRDCRVQRVDLCNAVCMVHNPDCIFATPYGNYCEHPLVDQLTEIGTGGYASRVSTAFLGGRH